MFYIPGIGADVNQCVDNSPLLLDTQQGLFFGNWLFFV